MDGVLLDSAHAIVESLRYALTSIGETSLLDLDLNKFVGPPLHSMINELIPNSLEETKESFVLNYRQHNNQYGPDLTPIFDGIPELLDNLLKDFELVVATSKLESAAVEVLTKKHLHSRFSSIFGTRPQSTDTKGDVIGRALNGRSASDVVAMVGDRVHDIEGANRHKLRSIGVTWGYALPGELTEANPTHIAESPTQLAQIIRLMTES